MKNLFVILVSIMGLVFSTGITMLPVVNTNTQPIDVPIGYDQVECINTGVSTTPPWLQLDPPWDPSVRINDIYNRNDEWLSMAVDANGRIYVTYQSPWGGTGASTRYGSGVASSTDQGLTWDNRVFYVNNVNRNMQHPDIAISDNGKINLWFEYFRIEAGQNFVPGFMRSRATCYNNPDSLYGVSYFAILNRKYPDAVTMGNGNQFLGIQWTVDQTGTANDSIWILFTQDSAAYYAISFQVAGGYPGASAFAVDALGSDTIWVHGIEYFDVANNDWDIACYFDTLGGSSLYGWTTSNTLDDRHPSLFSNQGFSYLAFQSDIGSGNNEIVVTNSTDYGVTWDVLQNLSNDGAPDRFPRVHGFYSTVGCAWIHGDNQTLFSYSEDWGQGGTWNASEIITTAATADTGYHCVALQHTPAYFYTAWEDNQNFATDSIEIYTSRRVAPIGVQENTSRQTQSALRVSPNPLRDRTDINFILAQPGRVDLSVFDAAGRIVKNLIQARAQAGNYKFAWDRTDNAGRPVQSGVYFCRLTTTQGSSAKSLIVVP